MTPRDFEILRQGLLELDPETRAHVIAAIPILRSLPESAAVRILAQAALRSQLESPMKVVSP